MKMEARKDGRFLTFDFPGFKVGTAVPTPDNTTLTLVVTNQTLSPHSLRQTARQVHSSMARAIQPFHTIYDGDVLYMVTTNAVESKQMDPVSLGLLASDAAWDAVLSCSCSKGV